MIEGAAVRALRTARRTLGLVVTTARLGGELRVPADARGFARRAQRTARELLAIHGIEVACEGPMPEAPAILVTNHLSYLDPLVLSSVVPCVSIAKGETERWPLVGAGLRALGVLFVRRGDATSGAITLLRARRALLAGASVLNFPEGTTSDGHSVGAFRSAIFGLPRLRGLEGVPIVPAHLSYDDDRIAWYGGRTLPPHYAQVSAIPRIRARVAFAPPLRIGPSEDRHAVALRAHDAVSALAPARGPLQSAAPPASVARSLAS